MLVWCFLMQEMEIQNGVSLIVCDLQFVLFVNEGIVVDVFGFGMYKLMMQMLLVLIYLKNWDKFFEFLFKLDVYFFLICIQFDQKWGMLNLIIICDKEFGIVWMCVFGIYFYYLSDVKIFYQKIFGICDSYGCDELEGQLCNMLVVGMIDLFGELVVVFIDMVVNQDEFGKVMFSKMMLMFVEFGLIFDLLVVQNIFLFEELQKVFDQKIGMNMIGDMGCFIQYQVVNVILEVVKNEGGMVGMGVGFGVGVGFGQVMGQVMVLVMQLVSLVLVVVLVVVLILVDEVVVMLEKLYGLMEKGVLIKEEFEVKKVELFKKLI